MKTFILLSILIVNINSVFAQRLKREDISFFQKKEDSLKKYALKLIQATSAEDRFKADSTFTKMLVRALVKKNSLYFPFDSLITISKLYAPDSSFRIFTWQMVINESIVRQHGAIQMKTKDGSLKLFPLIDKSDITVNLADTITDNRGWIGAVYYKIIKTSTNNKFYYTLLGYDENNIRSNRKIIEVLHFKNDEPIFGDSLFSFQADSLRKPTVSRYIMEYKKDAGARLRYDEDLNMVVFEHLESETNEPKKKWTFIPDGDYEGFKWENGKWLHVNKVFSQVTAEGQEPVPNPIKDEMGNTMEEKLKDNFFEEKEIKQPSTNTKKKSALKTKGVTAKKKVDE